VAGAIFGLFFHALGIALGDYFYEDEHVKVHLAGKSPATIILLVSAGLTLAMALAAMIALRRTAKVWPLRLLRNSALVFTFLNALVDFATEGFAALITLGIGLFGLAILSYQVDVAVQNTAVTPPTDSAG
jgi:TctA family transporter